MKFTEIPLKSQAKIKFFYQGGRIDDLYKEEFT